MSRWSENTPLFRPSRWATLVLGIAAVVVGAVLTAQPFRSLTVLAWLVAIGLVLTGLTELVMADSSPTPGWSRSVALVWIVAGVAAAAWPGITITALAVVVGVVLVITGVAKVVEAVRGFGDERFVAGLNGLTSAAVGGLALAWPAVTVLVMAVVFGVRTVLFGLGQIARALRMRSATGGGQVITLTTSGELVSVEPAGRWSSGLRLVGAVLAFAVALGGTAISVVIHRAGPDDPGAFYSAPSSMPDGPTGTIIRSEVVDGYFAGATTHRVLYISTGFDGEPTAVSGIIVVPNGPVPDGGRKVLAYTHGTVGVAPKCAPSIAGGSLDPLGIEGGPEFIAAGYVIASTDYQGLGTAGPHPYLVGSSEAMNALDIVRAARNLSDAHAGSDFAVWGHSQGGHASLFTGQLAATYAPELHLVGVAAGAPVPDLIELFKVNIETTVGKILIAMAMQSWSRLYDAELGDIVTPAARPIVGRIAENCLYSKLELLASVPGALALELTFVSKPPWEADPWKTIAASNTPGQSPTGVPMLVTQGAADTIVDPSVTEAFVSHLCANGEHVEFHLMPGIGHLDGGPAATPKVVAWMADRFAGRPATFTCT